MLTEQSATQLIHALISSRIDYCNSILYGMSDSKISDLQHIQNTAAHILTKCGNSFIHNEVILKKLHWLPIKQRIVYTLYQSIFVTLLLVNTLGNALLAMLPPMNGTSWN